MSNFLKLLEENDVDTKFEKKGEKKDETRVLKVNFKELLSEALNDILSEKSSLYRNILEKGVIISFDIKMPSEPITGHMFDLVSKFKEDMQ